MKNPYTMERVILEAGKNENLDLFIFRCKVNGCNPSFIHVTRGNKNLIQIIDLKKNETVYDYEKNQDILNYEDDIKDDIH